MAKKPPRIAPAQKERESKASIQDDVGNQAFTRLAHRAYMRDGSIFYDSEALMLALLLHTTGTAARSPQEMKQVQQMLDDPNLDRKRKPNRKR